MPPWNAPRAKVQLKLSIQRLQLLQDKKTAIAKQTRREIADLLLKGKVETARVRCEVVIGDEITVELLELLSLYAELLLARFALLDNPLGVNSSEPDLGIHEAVCSIIYAAPRTEVRELQVLRDIVMHKYSREFALAAIENKDGCVNDRVFKKLQIFRPPVELIDAYLDEIARTYKVPWNSGREKADLEADVPVGFQDGIEKEVQSVAPSTSSPSDSLPSSKPSPATSTTVVPPPPSYDTTETNPPTDPKPSAKAQQKTADDILAARFAALKQSYTRPPSFNPPVREPPRDARGKRFSNWMAGTAGLMVGGTVGFGLVAWLAPWVIGMGQGFRDGWEGGQG